MKIIKQIEINTDIWGLGNDGKLYWRNKNRKPVRWADTERDFDYPDISFMKMIAKEFGELLVWL